MLSVLLISLVGGILFDVALPALLGEVAAAPIIPLHLIDGGLVLGCLIRLRPALIGRDGRWVGCHRPAISTFSLIQSIQSGPQPIVPSADTGR
jgi:hypothetical protein